MFTALPPGWTLCPVCQAAGYKGNAACCDSCIPPAEPDAPAATYRSVATRVVDKPSGPIAPPPPSGGWSGQATPADPTATRRQTARPTAPNPSPSPSRPDGAARRPAGVAVEFDVPGRPVPKARPRVVRDADPFGGPGTTRTFTPRDTVEWEATVRQVAALHVRSPLDGPVQVEAWFYGASPQADLDNLLKAVLDGMQPVAFADDRQVTRVIAERVDGVDGDAKVRVRVSPLRRD